MAAISSPLLETSIAGATGVLISITASEDIQLDEVEIASQMIHEEAHPDATIIWGAAFDPSLVDEIKVTIIATGFIDSNGNSNEHAALRKTTQAPVVNDAPTPVAQPEAYVAQPATDPSYTYAPVVTPTVAPVVNPVVNPTVTHANPVMNTPPVTVTKIEHTNPYVEKDSLEDSIKKADKMISFVEEYDDKYVFLKKNKKNKPFAEDDR
jgi:hypothetical protein